MPNDLSQIPTQRRIGRQTSLQLVMFGMLVLFLLGARAAVAQQATVGYPANPKVVALPEIVIVAHDRAAAKRPPAEVPAGVALPEVVVVAHGWAAEKRPPTGVLAGLDSLVRAAGAPTGDHEAFAQYLKMNVRYPKAAREAGTQGTVYVQFMVGPDGSRSEVKALNPLGQGLDQEAVRVVTSAPGWRPGPAEQPEPQRAIVPLVFKIN
jgi:periplasmic protein TonB